MKRPTTATTLLVLVAASNVVGCTADVVVGDRRHDGGIHAPDARTVDGGADAPRDAGPPFCVVGTARCVAAGREIRCVFLAGGERWQSAPCASGRVCEGEGVCADVTGLDLSPMVAWPPWAHPDVGITEAGGPSRGETLFSCGVHLASPFGVEVGGTASSGGMPVIVALAPRSGQSLLGHWSRVLSFVPDVGDPAGDARSAWEPAIETGLFVPSSEVPVAGWYFSPNVPRTMLDPLCGGSEPSPACFARSFEGTLVTGDTGTRFVLGELPTAAYYDACSDEIVVRGVPFAGISGLGGTTFVAVETRARLSGSGPPTVPISDTPIPGAAEPGDTVSAAVYRGGAWQIAVEPPRTVAECEPAPGTDCIRPCTARALDLSGTTIVTSAPAVVVVGHTCASAGATLGCGYAIESVPPLSSLGLVHHVPGPAAYEADEIVVHVVATEDGTTVSAAGTTMTLAVGETVSIVATGDVTVDASAPVLVARRSRRASGDGLASVVVRSDAGLARSHLVPGREDARALVVLRADDTLEVDGVPSTATPRPFDGDPTLAVVELVLTVGSGVHRLDTSSPSQAFFAAVPDRSHALAVTRAARL